MIWVWINGKFEKIIKLKILFSSSSMGNSGLARVSVDCSPRSSRQVLNSGTESTTSRNIPGQIV